MSWAKRNAIALIFALVSACAFSAAALAQQSRQSVHLTLTIRTIGEVELLTPTLFNLDLLDRLTELPPINMRLNANFALSLLQSQGFWFQQVAPGVFIPYTFSDRIEEQIILEVWSEEVGGWISVAQTSAATTIGPVPSVGEVSLRYRLLMGDAPPDNLALRIVHTLISGL